MSFRRKDSVSPACDHILLPIDSGTKQVSRNICERNIHVPILASLQAQVSTGSCHTWARYRGVPAWEMLDAETVKRGIPGRAPGLRASWVLTSWTHIQSQGLLSGICKMKSSLHFVVLICTEGLKSNYTRKVFL